MSVFLKLLGMMLSTFGRFCISLVNLGQWRKKWFNVSISRPQTQIGLSVSKKLCLTFHDGGRYHIETIPLICSANQWTGFFMILASVMKGLNLFSLKWLRPTRRRVRKTIPFGWLTLKTSLLWGLKKFEIFFWKVEYWRRVTNILIQFIPLY